MTIFGYEMKTTFWQDFSIAERFGISAIKDTYNRAFNEWKHDYVYLTELVLVLNWKGWAFYDNGKTEISNVYFELWEQTDNYAYENLEGDELNYFLRTTD